MSNLDLLIKSIDFLEEDTKPKWGKMSCPQMLKHCNRFIQVYTNEVKFKAPISLLSPIFGRLHIFWLRHIIRYNVNKYFRNLPTLRYFNTYRITNIDFTKEKEELANRIKFVIDYKKDYIKNTFHGKIKSKTFKDVVDFHTRYHLTQFGVI
jgi:hypothetical protein